MRITAGCGPMRILLNCIDQVYGIMVADGVSEWVGGGKLIDSGGGSGISEKVQVCTQSLATGNQRAMLEVDCEIMSLCGKIVISPVFVQK